MNARESVQWNAWMRRTRKDPPTMEELETDYMRQLRLASNVERLAIEYKLEKLRALEPPVVPSATLAAPGQGPVTLPTSFPPPSPEGLPTLELGSDGVDPGAEEDAATKAAAEGERQKAMLRREFGEFAAKFRGGAEADGEVRSKAERKASERKPGRQLQARYMVACAKTAMTCNPTRSPPSPIVPHLLCFGPFFLDAFNLSAPLDSELYFRQRAWTRAYPTSHPVQHSPTASYRSSNHDRPRESLADLWLPNCRSLPWQLCLLSSA